MILYGIPNCDTIRKARHWLDDHHLDYQFHDYRKQGISKSLLQGWIKKADWESLINRRGTTWRKLPESMRERINPSSAIELMLEQPTLIKRPVLVTDNDLLIGFDEQNYRQLLKK